MHDFEHVASQMTAGMMAQRLQDVATEAWNEGLGTVLVEVVEEDDLDLDVGMRLLANGWIGSYRGWYEQMAIGFQAAGASLPVRPAKLAYMVTEAFDREHQGYKGGSYRYDTSTRIWLVPAKNQLGMALVDIDWQPSISRLRLVGRPDN